MNFLGGSRENCKHCTSVFRTQVNELIIVIIVINNNTNKLVLVNYLGASVKHYFRRIEMIELM